MSALVVDGSQGAGKHQSPVKSSTAGERGATGEVADVGEMDFDGVMESSSGAGKRFLYRPK
jgi:hypothetical protein